MVSLCRVPSFSSSTAASSHLPDLVSQIDRRQLKQYRIVALDLDGTLLNSKGQISRAQARYLRELHRRGVVLILCTGRGLGTVLDHLLKLDIPDAIPVVCSNGSTGLLCQVTQPESNRKIVEQQLRFDMPLRERVAEKTIEMANQFGYVVLYYNGDEIYANPKNPKHYELTTEYKELTGNDVILVGDDFISLLKEPNTLPSRLHILGVWNPDFFYRQLEKDANVMTKENRKLGRVLQVMSPHVSKGLGLQRLCENLGLPMESCVAIGDGENDVELLQVAGLGLALSNARLRVQATADAVMKWTNDQDGVMKTLQKLEREGLLWAD